MTHGWRTSSLRSSCSTFSNSIGLAPASQYRMGRPATRNKAEQPRGASLANIFQYPFRERLDEQRLLNEGKARTVPVEDHVEGGCRTRTQRSPSLAEIPRAPLS